MAQTDLTGLLTGITSAPIDPMLNASLGQRAIARGEALGKSMRQNIGAFTGANTQTTKEKVEERLAQLDINEPNDQEEILKLVSVVNPQGAAQLKAQFAQQGRGAILKKYGADRPDLLELATQGMSLKDIDAFATEEGTERYQISGNNVFDKVTATFITPPETKSGKSATKVQFYDAEKGANVIQFVDPDDPTIVLRELLDSKDIGRQSASLLKLQSENLKAANSAGREAREANAVALRLEKAAEQGMTGGVIATGEEFLKSILGTEDEVTLLRKSADRLRVSRGVANLPVGPASDKDVALVMGGELEATANPATVAAYVRGIAKLAKAERDFYSSQNAWLDRYKDNGGFSSHMAKEQLETQLGHSSIVAAEKRLAEVNYDPAALAIFEQKFGFDYMAAKEELDRANKTLAVLKREDF
jgi:hypothetical protein